MVDGSEVQHLGMKPSLIEELNGAKFLVLDDINKFCNYQIQEAFLEDLAYNLVACDPGLRGGYAVFKRGSEKKRHEGTYVTEAVIC